MKCLLRTTLDGGQRLQKAVDLAAPPLPGTRLTGLLGGYHFVVEGEYEQDALTGVVTVPVRLAGVARVGGERQWHDDGWKAVCCCPG